jgi:hypothetical protein
MKRPHNERTSTDEKWNMPAARREQIQLHKAYTQQTNNVTSVAMRFTEAFMPAIHRKSLELVVVTFLSPEQNRATCTLNDTVAE